MVDLFGLKAFPDNIMDIHIEKERKRRHEKEKKLASGTFSFFPQYINFVIKPSSKDVKTCSQGLTLDMVKTAWSWLLTTLDPFPNDKF